MVKLHLINPVAKALLTERRKPQVVPPKKGKGSYNRKKEKEKFNAKARSHNISED
jgi:stalled ribosome alternative rescue factor ArfA|tara:strand:+ start:66 stop:230 length:165 start_codon:yes stop_codon:yes gene_type:complete